MNLPSEVLNREFVLQDEPPPEQEQPREKDQVITTHAVLVGNIGLLLPQNEVSELIDKKDVCRLPNTPPWFSGVTSVRGNMIPVFDLHELLGVEGIVKDRKMIVVGSGDIASAFWVDEMPCMVMVTSDDSLSSASPLPPLLRNHASGHYFKDEQIWTAWDIQDFFTDLGNRL